MTKFPVLAAIASLSLALPGAAIANETIAHLKGHPAVSAPKAKRTAAARVACHPEPSKGRDCRHRALQADAKAAAQSDAAQLAANESAR
ncbi:hypothetical protein [Novosphingobium clariflavum]|uniref:Uncharacterized protein n=1 Tax=Novosphingobium clariflavum TaxID=2029884 RepID=A0ABV6SBP6_9SPHN|nr:hypothetical protein [Novosphingobium clariflavum]